MKKYFTTDRLMTYAIIIFLLFLCIDFKKQAEDKNLALVISMQKTDSITNAAGKLIALQQVILNNNQKEIKSYTDSVFQLKKSQEKKIREVIAFYKGITSTVIKEVPIPYIDSNSIKKWSDSLKNKCSEIIAFYEANTIMVPRKASDSTKDYSAALTATREGIIINSLSIPDSQYIRFVTLKEGFLKKNQQGERKLFLKRSVQVQVLHSNPNIHVTGQSSVIYSPPQKKRWGEKVIIAAIGIYLGTKL